ncbi:MAG: alpha-galactosidase [Kiritimatiellae bacterium]|nr:alpha-galactosidase [Kiritimatiellia bacterium]
MPKIAMIGAGSIVFCKTLAMDILATDALKDSECWLMNRTQPKLDNIEAFMRRVVDENRLPATIHATLDRRAALDGADYVVVMIQVGGIEAFGRDYEIPLKYGVDQCIGDSIGPGGILRGLRTIPVLVDIARDMEALCPDALMLQYANPMAINCLALGQASNVRFIGLCHGVQTTLDLIGRYVDVPKTDIDFLCAGINHMAWFLALRHKETGVDLYPRLRANIEKPEYYVNEKVRGEVMRHFGYFMTESSGHLSEYIPWFRKNGKALATYCDEPAFGGESGAAYKGSKVIAEKYEGVDYLARESPQIKGRSVEYGSYILEAMQTDMIFRLNGNVMNDGYIANLPRAACVEVPVFVDRGGLHPVNVGALPPPCAALNQSNITVHQLAVEAALRGDPELAMQAVAMDPLTSAVCTLAEVREMTRELLEAQADLLPQFKGRTLRPTPRIHVAPGTRGVDVPLDPALAIANRFVELAEADVTAKGAKGRES